MAQEVVSEERRRELATRLKTRRRQMALTQKEAAQHIGVSYEVYVSWEHARAFPRMTNLRLLEQQLELNLSDLAIDEALGEEHRATLDAALEPLRKEIARLRRRVEAMDASIQGES